MTNSPTLEVIQGTQVVFPINVKRNGAPISISGASVIFSVKRHLTDADNDAVVRIVQTTHVNAAAGQTSITIPPTSLSESGRYYYDVMVNFSGNIPAKTMHGVFIIHKAVTQSA